MNGLYFYCSLVGMLASVACVVCVAAPWIHEYPKRVVWRVAVSIAMLFAGAGFAAISGWGFEHAPTQRQEASK